MLAQSTGWATAARECVEAAAPQPVISFGARHVHPDITDVLDYAAIVGGCVGASTPAGRPARRPRADRDDAPLAGPDLRRHGRGGRRRSIATSSPTCPGSSSSTRSRTRPRRRSGSPTPSAIGCTASGSTRPSERGRVTPDLVHEVRARLDQAGFGHVKIVVSGGLNPERMRVFKDAGAPVDSYAVGSYISGATPIDFTGDIKEIDGRPIAKRGRIPGRTDSPRLRPVGLEDWREG